MYRMIAGLIVGASLIWTSGPSLAQHKVSETLSDNELQAVVDQLFGPSIEDRLGAIESLKTRGKPDVAAALIQLLRFSNDDGRLVMALEAVTGAKPGSEWHQWMLWQEAHPVKPFKGFSGLKADLMSRIDPNFRLFLRQGIKHTIRLEEITWGGVVKDGIPALVNPELIAAKDATYLTDEELVFGVDIGGDVRAYPLRIMDWHEMFNDVIGDVPVALAYCTLCGSGILFETKLKDRDKHFVFGSSGFLYRSNKLMYDRETNSLWNQFTGKPVVGELTGSGIKLKLRPVSIQTWKAWRTRHPDDQCVVAEYRPRAGLSAGAAVWQIFHQPGLDVSGAGDGSPL